MRHQELGYRDVGATGWSPFPRKKLLTLPLFTLTIVVGLYPGLHAQQDKKPLERVRITVPAKSLTFMPYYFGKAHGIFAKEGIDLEIIVMRPPLGVRSLPAGQR